jgi:hypothetical protein
MSPFGMAGTYVMAALLLALAILVLIGTVDDLVRTPSSIYAKASAIINRNDRAAHLSRQPYTKLVVSRFQHAFMHLQQTEYEAP